MNRVIAYIRTSTDKQDLNNQKLEILEFARNKNLKVNEFIQLSISSRKNTKARRIDDMLETLKDADILIVTELSRLGRSTAEVIGLVNALIQKKVQVIIIKQNLDIKQHDMTSKVMITMLSLFSELERDLISIRTKEALATKRAQGIKLGKPKGTIQRSKFDKDVERIKELLELGLSVRKIAKHLNLSSHIGLNTYINKRALRKALQPESVKS